MSGSAPGKPLDSRTPTVPEYGGNEAGRARRRPPDLAREEARLQPEVFEIDQIVSRFPRRYILLDSCRFSDGLQVTHGRVVQTSDDREEVYAALRQTPNSVIIYAGPGGDSEGAFLNGGLQVESSLS